jgi:hypothetical protein
MASERRRKVAALLIFASEGPGGDAGSRRGVLGED